MNSFPIRTITKEEFPPLLKEINDPPQFLHLQGQLPPTDFKWLCIVGSRKHTIYGQQVCEKLISGLAGYPIAIVSGLALGIDSIAHSAALQAHLPTIAVPGSGLDEKVLYPSSNRSLAHRILTAGGGLLSEFENDFRATNWSFPQRNRIMAGMSHAVLVIEAEKKSGTLITARLATEYNRELLVVPGSIFSSTSEGPHLFLKIGATPITSSSDILDALGIKTNPQHVRDFSDCTQNELKLIGILKQNPLEKNTLLTLSGLEVSEGSITLSLLELKNVIEEKNGKIFLK